VEAFSCRKGTLAFLAIKGKRLRKVRLPVHRAGLPRHAVASRMRANDISFFIVPLDPLGPSTPPTRRGLRALADQHTFQFNMKPGLTDSTNIIGMGFSHKKSVSKSLPSRIDIPQPRNA